LDELCELLARATAADASPASRCAAFDAIVARFQEMAVGCALTILGDRHLAEDVAQEAFLRAWLGLPLLREPAAFPSWFQRILLWQCNRVKRGRKLDTVSLESVAALPAEGPDPHRVLERRALQERVRGAVRALPQKERVVTELFYLEQLTQNEIALGLEVPLTTVKKRLHDARQRLQRSMVSESPGHPGNLGRRGRPTRREAAQLRAAIHRFDHATVAALLARRPALVHTAEARGISLLSLAAHAEHHAGAPGLCELLVRHGAASDIFVEAARGESAGVARRLDAEPGLASARDGWGRTPLLWAAHGGHVAAMEPLRAAGADIHARAEHGWSALHLAAEFGHVAAVQRLLEWGAEREASLVGGWTPIHSAAAAGHGETVAILARHGGAVDLFTAAALGWIDRARALLERDPELVHARLGIGLTPLQMAARAGRLAMARFLLERGAALDVIAALDLGWRQQIPALLRDRPALVDDRGGPWGATPLHYAAGRADAGTVRLLLAHGADVNARDGMWGETPARWAPDKGAAGVAGLLSARGGSV
jgi:RNA polymerase sigma factor (sigma-70 family)